MPKLHDKAIIRPEPDEVAIILDNIETYENQLTGKKTEFFLKTKIGDIAIITLFLGTGIRVSECIGLDVNDVNFRENSIRIIRKGGNESVLYFEANVLGYSDVGTTKKHYAAIEDPNREGRLWLLNFGKTNN